MKRSWSLILVVSFAGLIINGRLYCSCMRTR